MAEQNEPRQRYGYTTEGGERVSALRDMFNGGGPGQSGPTFQGGGILSAIGNALGGPSMFGGGSDEGGNAMGGFLSPAGMVGGALGGALFGPFGGLLGSIIGRQIGRGNQAVPTPDGNAPSLMAPAMAPASTAARLAPALSARPQMRSSGPGPMVPNYMPMQPGMNVMPDGETFLRQDLAVIPAMRGPMMTMPQTDIGTVRPFISRSTGRIPPMMDFPPMRGVTNPPPLAAMLLPR